MPTVTIQPVAAPDELFCHYPNETGPQEAVLELNLETGVMSCGYRGEPGHNSVPATVWHRRTLRFGIPILTAAAANQLMNDAAAAAQRILDGAEIYWDGSNHVGRLDDDAAAAEQALAHLCDAENFDPTDLVEEWTPNDWFSEGRAATAAELGISAGTTDEQVAAIAKEQETLARDIGGVCGYGVLTGALEYLTETRDMLVEEQGEAQL